MNKEHIREYLLKTIIVVGTLFVFIIGVKKISSESNYESIDFSKSWSMITNGKSNISVDVTEEDLNIDNKGDSVLLLKLPDEKVSNPALFFRTYNTVVEVYIDSNLIYESGIDRFKEEKIVGCGYHFVSLPENYYMRSIAIRLTATEDNSFKNFESMEIVNADVFTAGYIGKNLFGIFTTLFLIMLGAGTMIVCLFAGIYKKAYTKIFYIGSLSFLIGIWTQCYYGYSNLFCNNDILNYYMEHLSLFLMPLPMLLFVYGTINYGIVKKIIKTLILVSGVFLIVSSICHFTNIVHYNSFVVIYHILAVIVIVMTIVALFTQNIENKKARNTMRGGIICLGIGMLGELVQYNIFDLFGRNDIKIHLVPVAGIIFIVCAVLSNLFIVMNNLEEQVKQQALMKMAYSDTLTGLSNRKCCEDKMSYIDQNNIKKYGIINFDLNWLKKINDGLGHVNGDEYLCEFAKLIKECCPDNTTIGRMGGDEFIAIFEDVSEKDLEAVLARMNEKSGNGNMPETREIGNGISFAYGYCVSTAEMPLATVKAYEIADERMYECKKKQKVGRK